VSLPLEIRPFFASLPQNKGIKGVIPNILVLVAEHRAYSLHNSPDPSYLERGILAELICCVPVI
jgi:hypothetical protein